MQARTVILLGIGLVVVGIASVPFLVHQSVQSRINTKHEFALSMRPESLTEEVALAKARETLTRDGLDISSWKEVSGSRQINSNRAVIMFTNGTASTRFVHVELDGDRIVCQASVGK